MACSIQQESLAHLKQNEIKSRSQERTRAREQTNKAVKWAVQLHDNYLVLLDDDNGLLPSSEHLVLLDEKTSWKDVKNHYQRLENTIDEFKKIQKFNGICISKVETALLHAKKNIGKSLRRSQRIANIVAAQEEINE